MLPQGEYNKATINRMDQDLWRLPTTISPDIAVPKQIIELLICLTINNLLHVRGKNLIPEVLEMNSYLAWHLQRRTFLVDFLSLTRRGLWTSLSCLRWQSKDGWNPESRVGHVPRCRPRWVWHWAWPVLCLAETRWHWRVSLGVGHTHSRHQLPLAPGSSRRYPALHCCKYPC